MFLEAFEGLEIVHPDHLPVHQKGGMTVFSSPAGHIGVISFTAANERGEDLDGGSCRHFLQLGRHGRERAFRYRHPAVRAMLGAEFGKEKSEELVDLGDGRHGRLPSAACDALLDGDTWRQTLDPVDVGLLKLFDELAGIGRHAVEEPPLPLGEEDIEGKGRFTASAQAGDHHHLVARYVDGDVLEIVLSSPPDLDGA